MILALQDVIADPVARLQELEEALLEGVKKWAEGLLESCVALYLIREEGVYQYALGDEGEPLSPNSPSTRWNDYVRWRSRGMDFKRTMLLEGVSVIRILTTLGFTLNDILDSRIDVEPLIRFKSALVYQRETGEILGVKDEAILAKLPPGETLQQSVKEAILDIHSLPNPEERRAYVSDVIDTVPNNIFFWYRLDHLGCMHVGWNRGGNSGEFGKDGTPHAVVERARYALGMPLYE